MNPHLLSALDRLGGATHAAFSTWELRGSLRWTEGGSAALAIDGGWRIERRGRAPSWRFAVGAGPAARIAALWRTPRRSDLDPGGWAAACMAIEVELRDAVRSVRRATRPLVDRLDRLGPGRHPLKIEAFGRWRAFRRTGAAAAGIEERGIRLVIGTGDPPDGGTLEWCGDARALPPWISETGGLEGRLPAIGRRGAARTRRCEGPVPGDRAPAGAGPLVLLPGAAAWWVHEMAHAALEGAGRIGGARSAHRLAIVDDPGAGPWPAGFEVDDVGEAARPAELWSEDGPKRPADSGRRRRASVREPARPALSVTCLVSRRGRSVAWADLPDRTPVARGIRAGRFDPASGAILLELEGVGTVEGGVPVAGNARATALVKAADGWRGAHLLAAEIPSEESLAVCSRQGTALPVMVGAPTIVLEPVQLGR